ncbi:MAG: hypothetical protein Q4D76_15260, partial [Oscillospiraceae bacterium]|nr:hypothetical protein [Oscillospiraceae bacterium]
VNDLDDDIVCSYDKKTALDLSVFKTNERIAVYGKCEYSFKKYKIENVDKVIKPYSVKSSEQYYTLDGTTLDKTTSIRKSLNNNRIHYYIPNNWKNIEYNIIEKDLGNIEGYQYALNQIPESKDSEPESLFVCYFDSNKLKDPNDMKKKENVEKAIIENIEGSVGTFPKEKVKTYYGPTYKYYTGKFTDIYSGSKGYHVEYIFQEVEDRGIVMYVYFYREKRHLSDVMLVTRLLEVD